MNSDTKEQIIRTTLEKHFDTEDIDTIMQDWQSNYKKKPIHLLQKMVLNHCATAGMSAKANTIIKELLIEISKERTQKETEKCPQATFYNFYNTIYKSCPTDKQEKILNSFLSSLSDAEKRDMESFTSFFNMSAYFRSDAIEHFAIEKSQMRGLISKLYQSMCSWLGPVEADKIFHLSITQLKKSGHGEIINKLI